MKDQLRALKALAGPLPSFDPDMAPDAPKDLFAEWLREAIAAGVPEPHAMTVSTIDAHGAPDARMLILKNLDERGWHFAGTSNGPKGRQIALNPHVALTFYWPKLGRQVRIRGMALATDGVESRADFRARSTGARAAALLCRQSEKLGSPAELDAALGQQQKRLAEDPELVAPDWTVFVVMPHAVEFWQGDTERRHVRLCYRRDKSGWIRDRLWP